MAAEPVDEGVQHPEQMPAQAPRTEGEVIKVYRTMPSLVLGALTVGGSLAVAVTFLFGAGLTEALTPMAVMITFAAAGWMVLLRPSATLRTDGVVLRNLLTDVDVPFSHLSAVGSDWSLELVDTAGVKHSSWAIPVKRHLRPPKNIDRYAEATTKGKTREGNNAVAVAGHVQTVWQTWRRDGGRAVTTEVGVTRSVAPMAVGPILVAAVMVIGVIIF